MEKDFNYQMVPRDYVHCRNARCVRAADCLRFAIALRADKETPYFMTINPEYVGNGEECGYFQPDRLVRYASGITRLFADLPYKTAVRLKRIVHDYLGHSLYYRVQNKQRLLKPEEQDFIREAFSKEGVETEPQYDAYVELYDFFH